MADQMGAPGVYVKEVSTLGKSVVALSTSIPAFVGHTATGPTDPQRIRSLKEYEGIFGGAHAAINVNASGGILSPLSAMTMPVHNLYFAVALFFVNGGDVCWVLSVGAYAGTVNHQAIADAETFKQLNAIAEISLLCVPELPNIDEGNRSKVVKAMLQHCGERGDRFAIIDEFARPGDDIAKFRLACGEQHLSYGAAYYPQVLYGLSLPDSAINFTTVPNSSLVNQPLSELVAKSLVSEAVANVARANVAKYIRYYVGASGALAGIYGATDASRGVWKAPAGMSIAGVPSAFVLWYTQDDSPLYDTSGNGKDINRIRNTESQGAVVWGARTLAGNSLDYRYISVRRLMIFVGQSLKIATSFAVFEPNDAHTWLMLSNMCESFLNDLWRQGALMGGKPQEAYQVRIGLGKSMTAEDVLNGILNIDIALAPVRPAEFIVLTFSHDVQPA